MVSTKMWKALGVGITSVTGAMLLGITKIVDIEPSTNLFSTGITPGILFGIGLIVIAWSIQKNKI